jgi:hypothetical protein
MNADLTKAITILTTMVSPTLAPDAALKITQAALNLAHVAATLQMTEDNALRAAKELR